jgi:hypothetical protein
MTPAAAAAGADDTPTEQMLYEVRRKIYPRAVTGAFDRWRVWMVLATQIIFYGLPWLQWNGRQAVLFDLGARKFYLIGLVLWPQDVIYLALLLVLSALGLFLFTAVAGRLFCGYACPQTVYTEIFMWIERHIEGDRFARIRLDGDRQAHRLGADRAVDGLHLRRLLHAHPPAWHGSVDAVARPLGDLLAAVLCVRHLGQRGLHARTGVPLHVPVRTLPERDGRPGHLRRHL